MKYNSKDEFSVSKGRKHCGGKKNAGYQHFVLCPQRFLPFPNQISTVV